MKVEPVPFKAQWPKSLDPSLRPLWKKVAKVAWNILSIIVFPIGLCRIAYWATRSIALKIAIPGSGIYEPNTSPHKIALTAPDGAKLDGVFYKGKNPKKALIFGFGNGMQWETADSFLYFLKLLGVSVLCLNPRGVGNSTGCLYEEGYALDIYTAYEYLIKEEKLDPENIMMVGYSMGAAYGAMGAALIQEKYPKKKIGLFNLNSFSCLHKVAQEIGNKVNGCIGVLMRAAISCISFKIEAKKALDKLKGHIFVLHHPDDEVIPHIASMAKAVQKCAKRKLHISKRNQSGHCENYDSNEWKLLLNQLITALKIDKEETLLKNTSFTMQEIVNILSDVLSGEEKCDIPQNYKAEFFQAITNSYQRKHGKEENKIRTLIEHAFEVLSTDCFLQRYLDKCFMLDHFTRELNEQTTHHRMPKVEILSPKMSAA